MVVPEWMRHVRVWRINHIKSGIPRCYGMMPENLPESALRDLLDNLNMHLQDHPDDQMSLVTKGVLLTCLDQFDEGLACIEQVEKTAMHDGNTYVLASSYLAKGAALSRIYKHKGAVSYFKKALNLNPDNSIAHFLTGNALLEIQKFEDAILYFDRAIQLQFEFSHVYFKKACALNGCKKYMAALKCLKEILHTSPDYADAHLEMGKSYMGMEKFRHALKCHKRAIRADPVNVRAHLYLGITHMLIGQYGLAMPHLEKALSLDPKDPDVLEAIALLHDKMSDM